MKNIVDVPTANIYLNAALELGRDIEIIVEPISKRFGLYSITSKKTKIFISGGSMLSVDPLALVKISDYKVLAHRLFSKDDLLKKIVPKFTFIFQENKSDPSEIDKVLQFWESSNKKIVIKPNDKGQGKGVTIKPQSESEILSALDDIWKLNSEMALIEEFIDAKHEFRIIAWKGKIIDIFLRVPANVVGDGLHNISELISIKNENRSKLHSGLKPILMDSELLGTLAKTNLGLDIVPLKDHVVQVKSTCNLSTGGEAKRIDISNVHENLHKIVKNIHLTTKLNFLGIDLMSNDVTADPLSNNSKINEINCAPGQNMGYIADLIEGRPLFAAKTILEAIENDPVASITL